MQPHCRRAVAFIAASLQSADSSPLLVDLTANEVFSFAGELSARRVVITNNRDGTYFTGADECGMLSLYDHDAERFFTFPQDRGRFWGFDYGSRTYYSGQVQDRLVRIEDEECAGVFSYALGG